MNIDKALSVKEKNERKKLLQKHEEKETKKIIFDDVLLSVSQ